MKSMNFDKTCPNSMSITFAALDLLMKIKTFFFQMTIFGNVRI